MYFYIGGETSGESRFSNLQTGSKAFQLVLIDKELKTWCQLSKFSCKLPTAWVSFSKIDIMGVATHLTVARLTSLFI